MAISMQEVSGALNGAKILVLGGSGVIGSRLVEVLAGQIGVEVDVVVRTLSKAVRMARYPVRLIPGEVQDSELLSRAMEGCDIVMDLTYPAAGAFRERCTEARQMAGTIAETALKQHVRRVVHLSTISVYGSLGEGVLDETAPRRAGRGDAYGASKLAGEAEMVRYARDNDAPVVILQPTVVYGPFAGWTLGPISQLRRGRVVLPNGGDGLCNAVYLDDVVQAILRAAVTPGVEGETFLVSGDSAVSWKDFFAGYEAMLGLSSTVAMSESSVRSVLLEKERAARPCRNLIRLLRENGELRQAVLHLPGIAQIYAAAQVLLPDAGMEGVKDRLMNRETEAAVQPEKPLIYPSSAQMDVLNAKMSVSIAKARGRLGYVPAYSLEDGMKATREWVEWARLT